VFLAVSFSCTLKNKRHLEPLLLRVITLDFTISANPMATKLSVEDLSVLTHSQLAAAYEMAIGTTLTADSGLTRAAVRSACDGKFATNDLQALQTPSNLVYPDVWDSPGEAASNVSNRVFIKPQLATATKDSGQ
jgi:hypothetical protein